MQQTTERPTASPRQGFLRRFLSRGDGVPPSHEVESDETALTPHTVIDLRDDLPATQWRQVVSERLERLETGMSLVADTMKRAFAEVYRSVEDLRVEGSAPGGQLERILDESVSSLKAAVEDLAEAIHRVPYILAAAADDITAKLDPSSASAGTGGEAAPIHGVPPAREPLVPAEILPATPFELEPVEEQFVPMDDDPGERDARKIWGLEA
jgi:hypothetical protein